MPAGDSSKTFERKPIGGDSDSESSARPTPKRGVSDVRIAKTKEKKARRRDYPSEQLVERNPNEIDFSPALVESEITDIEKMIETATPEQFQQLLSLLFRKMMVRGLKDIPPPKSIKEMQVLYTMFRQAEGIEARDRGGGAPPAGFLPRTVSRKAMGSSEEVPMLEAEVVPDSVVEPRALEAADDGVGDDLFGSSEKENEEFEI